MSKSSRARTRERKQERQKKRQRNRQYMIIGGVAVVAVILIGLFALSNLPSEAPIPDTIDRYAGIEQDVDSDGYPVLGNPDAPVEVVEYASFSCSHCEEFHERSFPRLLERIEQGDIRYVYVPRDAGSVPNAEGANRGALCAGEQGKFWEMHDALYSWHNRFGNTAFQGNRITTGASELGLNMDDFNSCFSSSRISDILGLAAAEVISGTPSFKVNGAAVGSTIDEILAAIDSILGTSSGQNEPDASVDTVTEEATEAIEATEVMDEMTEEPEATEITDEAESTEAVDEATEEPEAEATEEE